MSTPCCICLCAEGPFFDPTCCVGGRMHESCGKNYIKALRIHHDDDDEDDDSPPPKCPACRRLYGERDLSRLLPTRRLFRCQGTFHPLDDKSELEVCIRETHGGIQRRTLAYEFGAVAELPGHPRDLPAVHEHEAIPWPFDPVLDVSTSPMIEDDPDYQYHYQQQQQVEEVEESGENQHERSSSNQQQLQQQQPSSSNQQSDPPTSRIIQNVMLEGFHIQSKLEELLSETRKLRGTTPMHTISTRGGHRIRSRKMRELERHVQQALMHVENMNDTLYGMSKLL